jgi:pimeloyl-ACP methyl ester carboxylesterase
MNFIVQNQLAYAYTGGKLIDPARRSLVFIHGAANDHSVWQLQSRYFAHHGFNVLAVDLPAHGRSGGTIKPTIGDYAGWLPGLLDAAGITSATLVGHSMGSLIAIEAAMRYPARVAGLALLGISIPMPVTDVLLHAARDDPATAFDMLNLWGHGPLAKMGKSPSPGLSLLGNYLRLLEESPPGALYHDLKACSDYHPDAAALKQIACPALLMIAARDQMTPAKAAIATAALLKNARTVSIEGAGHAMMTEAPDAVLDHLKTFLTT